ncbi:SRPBCC family protein [Mycolicibacterium flavescens]|uniref:Polyketide cyclase n=1 Tax=Mycolicibacterium flavescens TaxID=1776 RepID=A0A1E3R7H7_MYCFV|nr:SRPBCC family protein [Mycolicibacterium flavescens]MCV7281659.1 SRPBCC family protein [Mycolicibacterium flavescens]ODQ85906.1 polyketide cyclase [Mycolicibacterium flavescens]
MDLGFRRGMPTVELHCAAPREAVWDVITDLDTWPQWGPTVSGAELKEPGPLRLGSEGNVVTPVGLKLPFTITEFRPRRCWAWQVAGVGATRHEVFSEGDGSRIVFAVPLWATAYLPVCALALPRIARLAIDRR